jgi:hypothetical protein
MALSSFDGLAYSASQRKSPTAPQGAAMNLMQRLNAFGLAAVASFAILAGIDQLATPHDDKSPMQVVLITAPRA